MKNKFLRVLSFAMVAMFAFTIMGLIVGAEEWDTPVIEEIPEEELGEELIEEEVVEAFAEETEIAKENAYFEILDGDGAHVWYFAGLKDALASDKLQNGYTLLMLKDYTWDHTSADKSLGEKSGIDMPSNKTFIWNGGGHTITDNFDRSKYKRMTKSNDVWTTTVGGHDDRASYALTSANSKITIENITFSGNAQNKATSQGHTNGCLSVGAGTLTLKNVDIKNYQGWNGCAVWGERSSGKLLILEDVNVENCKVQNHGIIGVYSMTAEINGLTVKNSSGIAVGVGTAAGRGGKLTISNSNITSCTTGIVAGFNEKTNNMFTATIDDNVTISNCTTGICAYPGKEVNITGSNVNVKENSKNGIYIASLKDTGDLIGAVVNVTGSLNVTGNKSNGIYIAENSLLKLNGNVNITGNTNPSGKENNVYLAGTNQITIAGPLAAGSSIGISMAQSGATFGTPADGVTVDKTAFFADGAVLRDYTGIGEYTERRIHAAFYPETIGDGKLNGTTVIDTKVLSDRLASRGANELVLHWPWIVVKNDDTRYGYVSLKTAYENRGDGVIYAQKPMTVEYQWGDELTAENYEAQYKNVFATTEFPMWMPTSTNGVVTDVNHTDIDKAVVYIDGNGHVIDAEASKHNAVFVIYGKTALLQVDNFIFDGKGTKPFIKLPNNVDVNTLEFGKGFIANNSYLANGNQNVLSASVNGTLTLNNTAVSGNITVAKGGNLVLNNSKVINPNGTAIVTSSNAFAGEFATVYVNGKSYVNDPADGNIYMEKDIAKLVIGATFAGEIGIDNYIGQVVAGEDFGGTLATVNSITRDGAENATCAYFDGTAFNWTEVPALSGKTDSGVYKDKTGVIRFLTTFTTAPGAGTVENYGTYALFAKNFTNNMNPAGATFKSFEPEVDGAMAPTKAEQAFIVDVVDISEENRNTAINAISFVKLKGIETPVYYYYTDSVCVGDNAKNLGENPVAEGQAA